MNSLQPFIPLCPNTRETREPHAFTNDRWSVHKLFISPSLWNDSHGRERPRYLPLGNCLCSHTTARSVLWPVWLWWIVLTMTGCQSGCTNSCFHCFSSICLWLVFWTSPYRCSLWIFTTVEWIPPQEFQTVRAKYCVARGWRKTRSTWFWDLKVLVKWVYRVLLEA